MLSRVSTVNRRWFFVLRLSSNASRDGDDAPECLPDGLSGERQSPPSKQLALLLKASTFPSTFPSVVLCVHPT